MNSKRLSVLGFMVGILANLLGSNIALGLIWYVDDDAPAGGNGSSWIRAYRYVQDAISVARGGDEIQIAYGIYRPDQGVNARAENRSESFMLISGVTVRGGFPGFYTDGADLQQTIFSGDLKNNDHAEYLKTKRYEDNAYHVVTAMHVDDTAVLEGVTITAGYGSHFEKGGALYINNASPVIRYCIFEENDSNGSGLGTQKQGDNIWCEYSDPTITECVFKIGQSFAQGIYIFNGNPQISYCTFDLLYFNSSIGILLDEGTVTVDNCTFAKQNTSKYGGWGIFQKKGQATVQNCRFISNMHGIENEKGSLYVDLCHFEDNHYGVEANYNSDEVTTTITQSTFINQEKTALYMNSTGSIESCRFYANDVAVDARNNNQTLFQSVFIGNERCIFCDHGALDVNNCTFTANGMSNKIPIYAQFHQRLSLRNCIVWESRPDWIDCHSSSDYELSHCCEPYLYPGTGNIHVNPKFVRLPNDGGDGWGDNLGTNAIDEGANDDYGNLHLHADSPCIDAGNDLFVPEQALFDLDGDPRIQGSQVDMGVYEGDKSETLLYILAQVFNGHGRVEPELSIVNDGDMVTVRAFPDSGYCVKSWYGTDNDQSKALINTVTMNASDGTEQYVIVIFEPCSGQ